MSNWLNKRIRTVQSMCQSKAMIYTGYGPDLDTKLR